MEWVVTTGKTLAEAREQALDQLGVAEDDAEFEIVEEPKTGLFGRVRGEARVRARVRPTAVRPKQDRRARGRKGKGDDTASPTVDAGGVEADAASSRGSRDDTARRQPRTERAPRPNKQGKEPARMAADDRGRGDDDREPRSMDDGPPVAPEAVGEAAVTFMTGLAAALGSEATATLQVDGVELDVRVDGEDLGLLIGPGGRTLMAVQDLARVAAQRRLGDHETRLRIDVGGYRERRRGALEKFAAAVATEVLESGRSKALEPMTSADRKVIHDVVQDIDGVSSHSDGEEPRRRVVIVPG